MDGDTEPQSGMIDVYKNIDLNKITYDFLVINVKILKKLEN